jgi:hypothetical protein
MRGRQIWVDFNDIDEDGRARTLLEFAEPGVVPGVGDRLLAGDDEGNRSVGEVVDITPTGEVVLALDLATFEARDGAEEVALYRPHARPEGLSE